MNTLQEDLKAYNQRSRNSKTVDQLATMDGATQALQELGLAKKALKVGDSMPDFTLPNVHGVSINLKDTLQNQAAVISFYRGGWCPYCNLELRALQNILPQFKEANIKLIAISPQTPDNSLTTQEKNALTFEVLSDANNQVAHQFGLVHQLPENLKALYHTFNINLSTSNGDDSYELPLPATYLVNQQGEVLFAFVDEDYTKRVNLDELLAQVKKLS